MLIQHFEPVLRYWEYELERYSIEELQRKPQGDEGWSMGQLYTHIVDFTREFYIPKIVQCLEQIENVEAEMSYEAYQMFSYGNFPPFVKHRTTEEMLAIQNPETHEQIVEMLYGILEELAALASRIEGNASGKRYEEGLGYLGATEWFMMNIMHWRHHMLDQWELDMYLSV